MLRTTWALIELTTCEISGVRTINYIVAATAIPAASAPSFPSVTSITESLSLTQNHSGCWRYSLCYESACDLVIGLLHCNEYRIPNSHKYSGRRQKPDNVTQRPFSRELDLGAHFQESVDRARFLKIRFLKIGRFQAHKIGLFPEIRKWPDFRFQESWISAP